MVRISQKGIFPKKDIYEESDAISDVQVPIHRSAHVTATDLYQALDIQLNDSPLIISCRFTFEILILLYDCLAGMRRTFRVSVCPFRVQFGSMFISSSSSSCTAFAFFENQCCSRIITELWLTCTIEILANSVRFRIRGFRATCFRSNVCHALTKPWPPHEVLLLSYKLKLEHKAAPADLQMSFKFSNEGDRGQK